MNTSINLDFSDVLKFLRREVDRLYPHMPPDPQMGDLINTERKSLIRFIDNPQVRAGIREFCQAAKRGLSTEEISDLLAAHIIAKRPASQVFRFGERGSSWPYRERYIREWCKTLGHSIHVYLDLLKDPVETTTLPTQGLDRLPPKKRNLPEDYFVGLTDKQGEVLSLRLEYRLSISEIADRLGKHRATIEEHLEAASRKINENRSLQNRQKNRARPRPIAHQKSSSEYEENEDDKLE